MKTQLHTTKLDRATALSNLKKDKLFDLLIIGGGATGLGIALDASLRGLSVALVEQHDFCKGNFISRHQTCTWRCPLF